jgi:hypothetical protein
MNKSQIEQLLYAPESSSFSSTLVFDKYNKTYKITQSVDINITLAASGHLDNATMKLVIIPDNTHALTIDGAAFDVMGAFDKSQINTVYLEYDGDDVKPTAHILNKSRKVVDYTRSFVTSNSSANVITLNNGDGLLSFAGDVPFSIMCWVKLGTIGTENNILVKGDGSTDSYMIAVDAINKFAFFLRDTGSAYLYTKVGTTLSANTWYHLAVTYDGSKLASGVKMYLNAVNSTLENSSSGTFGTIKNVGTVKIGNRPSTGTFGDFEMAHLVIASGVLSFSEIQEAYNNAVAYYNLKYSTLNSKMLAYYTFFNSLADVSNNGTHTGSASSTTYSTDTP